MARWNVGAQAGCFIAALRIQAAAVVMRACLVFWGSGTSGLGANNVDGK